MDMFHSSFFSRKVAPIERSNESDYILAACLELHQTTDYTLVPTKPHSQSYNRLEEDMEDLEVSMKHCFVSKLWPTKGQLEAWRVAGQSRRNYAHASLKQPVSDSATSAEKVSTTLHWWQTCGPLSVAQALMDCSSIDPPFWEGSDQANWRTGLSARYIQSVPALLHAAPLERSALHHPALP